MSERTTIKATIDTLLSNLQANLVADPPTASKPFRRVAVGYDGPQQYPRPFLAFHLLRSEPIGVADNDKLVVVTMALRIVTDVLAADPHAAMLDTIGAVPVSHYIHCDLSCFWHQPLFIFTVIFHVFGTSPSLYSL